MNAYTHKDGRGSMFVNDRKTEENQPDRRGTAVIANVQYRISGWLKKDAQGSPYLSLSFTKADDTPKPATTDEIDW